MNRITSYSFKKGISFETEFFCISAYFHAWSLFRLDVADHDHERLDIFFFFLLSYIKLPIDVDSSETDSGLPTGMI